jgi:hypothetical protein
MRKRISLIAMEGAESRPGGWAKKTWAEKSHLRAGNGILQ